MQLAVAGIVLFAAALLAVGAGGAALRLAERGVAALHGAERALHAQQAALEQLDARAAGRAADAAYTADERHVEVSDALSELLEDARRRARGRAAGHRVAVVLPFIERQVDAVVGLLAEWRTWPPFGRGDGLERDAMDLVLYYHREPAALPTAARGALDDALAALAGDARQFAHTHFLFANLTDAEDRYPEGANHMFYNLFLRDATHAWLAERYRYLMLHEADVAPLRARWAWKVYDETRGSPFWVKGSQFRGRYLPAHIRVHINGNALYAVGDPDFNAFLARAKASKSLKMGYDGVIFNYVMMEGNWQLWYDRAHMFVFSDFIQNKHWTEFSSAALLRDHPNTFLVHGGNDTAPDRRGRGMQGTTLPDDY